MPLKPSSRHIRALMSEVDDPCLTAAAIQKFQQAAIRRKNRVYKFRKILSRTVAKAICAWNANDEISVSNLSLVLAIDEVWHRPQTKLFRVMLQNGLDDLSFIKLADEISRVQEGVTMPVLSGYISSGQLNAKIPNSGTAVPVTAPISDYSLVVVAVDDVVEWCGSIGREIPGVFKVPKAQYPSWLQAVLEPFLDQVPELKIDGGQESGFSWAPKAREIAKSILEKHPEMKVKAELALAVHSEMLWLSEHGTSKERKAVLGRSGVPIQETIYRHALLGIKGK